MHAWVHVWKAESSVHLFPSRVCVQGSNSTHQSPGQILLPTQSFHILKVLLDGLHIRVTEHSVEGQKVLSLIK